MLVLGKVVPMEMHINSSYKKKYAEFRRRHPSYS